MFIVFLRSIFSENTRVIIVNVNRPEAELAEKDLLVLRLRTKLAVLIFGESFRHESIREEKIDRNSFVRLFKVKRLKNELNLFHRFVQVKSTENFLLQSDDICCSRRTEFNRENFFSNSIFDQPKRSLPFV